MKMILVLHLIGSLIHKSEAYKPVVVIHGLKEKVSDLDFLRDNIIKVILIIRNGPAGRPNRGLLRASFIARLTGY